MIDTASTPSVAGNVRKYWWLFLIRGLFGLALGVIALVYPLATLAVVVILLGAYLIIDGAIAIVKAIQIFRTDAHWWVLLLEGIVGVGVGLVILAMPGTSILSLAFLVGFWAIFSGIAAIATSLRMHTHVAGEWLYLAFGVISLIFGIIVIFAPATGLAYIVLMTSIYGFVIGVTMIALAIRLRRLPAKP